MRFLDQTKLVAKRARLLAPLIALPLAVGCSGSEGDGASPQGTSHHGDQVVKEAKVYTIQELAKAIGCGKATVQIKATDVTQGYCNIKKQRYFLTTFPTKEGLKVWAAEEQGWGSVLVGNQWAIGVAPETLLPELQQKIGGNIQGEHQMAHDGEITNESAGAADTTGTGGN